jgi:hypothetical protein
MQMMERKVIQKSLRVKDILINIIKWIWKMKVEMRSLDGRVDIG